MKAFIIFALVFSLGQIPILRAQENCEKLTPEQAAVEKAEFDGLTKKFKLEVDVARSAKDLRERLLKFTSTEIKSRSALKDQVRLFKWQNQEAEKLKLAPMLSSELVSVIPEASKEDREKLQKSLSDAKLAHPTVEIQFEKGEIFEEDIVGLGDNGKLRILTLEAAKKDKDNAVKMAAERFISSQKDPKAIFPTADYLVVELNSAMIGRNGATNLTGHKVSVVSSSELKIQESIHINEKPGMFFTESIVNRPRALMFIKNGQGGISLSPTASVKIEQIKTVDK